MNSTSDAGGGISILSMGKEGLIKPPHSLGSWSCDLIPSCHTGKVDRIVISVVQEIAHVTKKKKKKGKKRNYSGYMLVHVKGTDDVIRAE